MHVENYGSNQTLITSGEIQVLYSYKTPVALIVDHSAAPPLAFKTCKKWSVTTSTHINKWLRKNGFCPDTQTAEVPQDVLDDWEMHEFTSELA